MKPYNSVQRKDYYQIVLVTWNHIIVNKLLVLDTNTWNYITVRQQIILLFMRFSYLR